LREYSQHIQITPSVQQWFINICNTTCFDPNGSSSGAASFTHSVIKLYMYVNRNIRVTILVLEGGVCVKFMKCFKGGTTYKSLETSDLVGMLSFDL
jgi:hypothetical protein